MRPAAALLLALVLAGCAIGPTPTAAPASPVPSVSSPAASPSETDPFAGQALIARATWTTNSLGRELQVVPTRAGRADYSNAASARAWAEVLAKAPDAGTPGMYDQFLCHWDFARAAEPNKPSWNLEPWRPAVGYLKTVEASCNPGGPES